MSTTSWRKNPAVTRLLADTPQLYSFYQAVRLLEHTAMLTAKNTNPVAGFTPPKTETIRFNADTSLTFPNSEIHSISKKNEELSYSQWQLRVNFLGLTGAMGVLPFHYTTLLLQRLKLKDKTLIDFLDLFNHRTLSLFYRAGTKYRLPLAYEKQKIKPAINTNNDPQTQVLLSLLGLGTQHLTTGLVNKPEAYIFYSGLFNQRIRCASGLKQILQHQFNVPIHVMEFIGQWQHLIDDVRSRLGSRCKPLGQNAQLGKSVILGRKGWYAQGKIRIIIGPLNKEQLTTFAPGSSSLQALNEWTKLYVGLEIDYEFFIRVKRCDMPKQLILNNKQAPIIGWNTWLPSRQKTTNKNNETIDIVVSSNRIK